MACPERSMCELLPRGRIDCAALLLRQLYRSVRPREAVNDNDSERDAMGGAERCDSRLRGDPFAEDEQNCQPDLEKRSMTTMPSMMQCWVADRFEIRDARRSSCECCTEVSDCEKQSMTTIPSVMQ